MLGIFALIVIYLVTGARVVDGTHGEECFSCLHYSLDPPRQEVVEALAGFGGGENCAPGSFNSSQIPIVGCDLIMCGAMDVVLNIQMLDGNWVKLKMVVRQCLDQFDVISTPLDECTDIKDIPGYMQESLSQALTSMMTSRGYVTRSEYISICSCQNSWHENTRQRRLCNGEYVDSTLLEYRNISGRYYGSGTTTLQATKVNTIIILLYLCAIRFYKN